MSKKLLGLLMATMLVLGFAGQSMANFSDLDLIRVIYDANTSTEYATNLGIIGTGNLATSGNVLTGYANGGAFTGQNVNLGGAFALSALGAGASSTDTLKVAYLAADNSVPVFWLSGPANRSFNGNFGANSLGGTFSNMYVAYGSSNTLSMTNPYGYYGGFDKGGIAVGSFAGFITDPNAAASEASFTYGTAGVLLTLTNYDFTLYNGINNSTVNVANVATLGLDANGNTILNPSAVPIPPSVLLLGSGLLGLIGLRRRTA